MDSISNWLDLDVLLEVSVKGIVLITSCPWSNILFNKFIVVAMKGYLFTILLHLNKFIIISLNRINYCFNELM